MGYAFFHLRDMSSWIRKAPLSFCFLFLIHLGLTVPLHAAPVTIEAQVGFHGIFQLGHPFPVRVELTNLGRPAEGILEVKVWKGGPSRGVGSYPFYYRREVLLPAQARKSVRFTVDPDSLSRPLTVSFSAPGERVSKEIDLRRHFSPSPLILLLTGDSVSPVLPSSSDFPGPIVALSPRDLPPDGGAYRGVSTVVFYEPSLRDLSTSQTLALERWLSSGGRMLVLGSAHYALYQEPSLSRFLPVRVLGLKRLSSVPSLERIYGKQTSFLKNLLVQDTAVVTGKVVIEEKGTPILVEMTRGKGKVFYLSLDVGRPPLSRWEGLAQLFIDLLRSPPERGSALLTTWNDSVFSRLLTSSSLFTPYAPFLSFLLWTLLYLGGLGLWAWLWQRQRWPRRILAVSLLAFIFFSSLGGHLFFDRAGNIPDGVLVSSTVLDSLPDGYVEVQSDVALFSTRRRHYNLQVESGWTGLEPVLSPSGRTEGASMVIEEEALTRLRFPLREWDYRLFKVRSMGRFPLHTELQKHGHRLSLKLTNLGPEDLTECWLIVSGQSFFLGDLLRGSSRSREFSLSEGESPADGRYKGNALKEISFHDKNRELLLRHSIFPQDQETASWRTGGILLFGWVAGGFGPVRIDDARVLTHNYILLRVTIPLAEEED